MTIRDLTVRRAIQGPHSGGRYLTFSKELMKTHQVRCGDVVTVQSSRTPSPIFLRCRPNLKTVLQQDKLAKERWETFTLGKKRSLAYSVSSAKRSETRIRRAVDLAEKIRTYNLHGDRKAN